MFVARSRSVARPGIRPTYQKSAGRGASAGPGRAGGTAPWARLAQMFVARSRSVARSGIRPTYQKSAETVAYVETAKTSHISGLRNCGQSPIVLGYGKSQ